MVNVHKDLISKLLGVTVKSVYNYEKEKRLIIKILNNYLTDEDAIEMIETGKIQKLETLFNSPNQKSLNQELIQRIERLENLIKNKENT